LPRISAKPVHHLADSRAPKSRPLEEKMTRDQMTPNSQTPQRRDHELDRRYGAIGISAVAAAVRCQKLGNKPVRSRESEKESDQAA
jgi:hypothetical protein